MVEWKDIDGYGGKYQISSEGFVRNTKSGRTLKPSSDTKGYTRVNLHKEGKLKTNKLHRLVAIYFLQNKEDLSQVNHINGIKDDNRVENLEWCDQNHNMRHAYSLELKDTKGVKNGRSSISEEDVYRIRTLLNTDLTQIEIAEIIGTSKHIVSNIKNKRTWNHLI